MATLQGVLTSQPQASPVQPPPYAANAGVRMLVSTGAVQAMAAPAPIRFSILRREIPVEASFRGSSGLIRSPPSIDPLDPDSASQPASEREAPHHPEGVTFLPRGGSFSTVSEQKQVEPASPEHRTPLRPKAQPIELTVRGVEAPPTVAYC